MDATTTTDDDGIARSTQATSPYVTLIEDDHHNVTPPWKDAAAGPVVDIPLSEPIVVETVESNPKPSFTTTPTTLDGLEALEDTEAGFWSNAMPLLDTQPMNVVRAAMTLLLVLMVIVFVLVVIRLAHSSYRFLIGTILLIIMAWFVGFTVFVRNDVLHRHHRYGVFLVDSAVAMVREEIHNFRDDWKHRRQLLLLTYVEEEEEEETATTTVDATDPSNNSTTDAKPGRRRFRRKAMQPKSQVFQWLVQPWLRRPKGDNAHASSGGRRRFRRRKAEEAYVPPATAAMV
jgi:hypothetical protein